MNALVASRTMRYARCKVCAEPLDATRSDAYCCSSCAALDAMLNASDLAAAYQEATRSRPTRTSTRRTYDDFDTDAFYEAHVRELAPDRARIDLVLEGVHCSACLTLLERLPRLVAGVLEARLDVTRATLRVTYVASDVALSSIATALDRLGYPPHAAFAAENQDARRREDRALLVRMAVAGASAGNVMLLAVALYGGESTGMDAGTSTFLRWASLIATLPAIFYSGDVFFRGALSSLRARTPHIDLPLAISLAAGFVHGAINTARGTGTIYFDSVAALIFALLASRFLHMKKQRAATDATDVLRSLAPATATRVRNGVRENIATTALAPGDVIVVPFGETVPADGRALACSAMIDRSLLTGESLAVRVRERDEVQAGTTVMRGELIARVTATGEATRVARLLREAQDASNERAPVLELANKAAGIFVIVAMVLAAATFIIWWHAGLHVALDRAIALLIVTCPCALGLATPLAMSSAMGRAAKRRLFIKGSDSLERLARARTVVFDKTGTLTAGKPTLAHWVGDRSVRPLVGALERTSTHPYACALASALDSELTAESIDELAGHGIRGRVSGRLVQVGALRWVSEHATCDPTWRGVAEELAESGASPVAIACDGEVVAIAGIADTVRAEALGVVRALRAMGVRVRILSGDEPRVVARVARELGVSDYEGGATPERKLAVVKALEQQGSVVMVGDGVNDAGALAAAGVGVAVHGGAEASLAVADVYAGQNSLDAITELVAGARRTMSVIHAGFACGICYNILGVTLAMTGFVTPLLAAIIMPASSLTVVTLAHQRRTFDEEQSS